jgi:hypothetical protein
MLNGKHLTPATVVLATLCLIAATVMGACPGLAQETTPPPDEPVGQQELPVGQEPAAPTFDLLYTPQLKSERRYALTARGPASATFEDGTELGRFDVQMSAELVVTVTEIKEESFVISVSIEGARLDASGVAVATPHVADAHPTMELTPRGEVVSTAFGESLLASFGLKGVDDYLVAALASILRLPDTATPVGGSWESRLQTGPDDARIITTVTSTLTSADEQTARITSDVTSELPPMELSAMNFPVKVYGGQLKLGKFVVALDRLQGALTSAEGLLQLSLRGDLHGMPLNVEADLDVKAKPWEAPAETKPQTAPE